MINKPVRVTLICLAISHLSLATVCLADKPARLSQRQIERLKLDGDRLADQGDYLAALGKYTDAYLGVVSSIRGQDFLKSVTPSIFNREQLGQEMLEQIEKEYTEDELLLMDSSYKVLGLMAPTLDGTDLMMRLLTEEVAGFYDPDNKRMVLIVEDGPKEDPGWFARLLGAKPAFDKDEQKTTLAHELTHALQDQLYDLNSMEEGIEDDDDMMLAFAALVEGDATLLMFAELEGGQDITQMDPEAMRFTFNIMSWMLPLAGGAAYREAPPIFRESLTFPYFQGMIFALTIAEKDGWSAIHRTYASPPLSTEQVLHPEKYRNERLVDVPQRVSIPDCQELLGDSWKSLGGNCLGEYQTSIMLKRVKGGTRAAMGWDGDRYEVYQNDSGELALLMVSIWDSEQDAQEFAAAYQTHRSMNPFGTDDVFLSNAVRSVKQDSDKVYIVDGFSEELKDLLMDKLAQSTFEDKQFPTPSQTAEK